MYYSHCCDVPMPNYPDSDICPDCKEHCTGLNEEEMEETGRKPKENSAYDLIKSLDQTIIEVNKIKKAVDDLAGEALAILATAKDIKARLEREACERFKC